MDQLVTPPVVTVDYRSLTKVKHIRVRFNLVLPNNTVPSFVIAIPRPHTGKDESTFDSLLAEPLNLFVLRPDKFTYTLCGNRILDTACLRDDDVVLVLPGEDQCASSTLLLESARRDTGAPEPRRYGTRRMVLSTKAKRAWTKLGEPRLGLGANASVTVLRSEDTGEMMLRLEGEVDCSLHDRDKNMVIDMIKVTLGLDKTEAPHLGYFPRPAGETPEQDRNYSFGWSRSVDLSVSAGVTGTGAPPPAPVVTPSLGARLGMRTERTRNLALTVTFRKTRLSHVPLLTLWNGGKNEYSGVTFVKKVDKIVPAEESKCEPIAYAPLSPKTRIPKLIKPTDFDDWSIHGINRDFRFGASWDVSEVAGLGATAVSPAPFSVVVCVEVYAREKGGDAYLYSNGRWTWKGLSLDEQKMVTSSSPVAPTKLNHFFALDARVEWQTNAWNWSDTVAQAGLLWDGLAGKIDTLYALLRDRSVCRNALMASYDNTHMQPDGNDRVGYWWQSAKINLRVAAGLAKEWSDHEMTGWHDSHRRDMTKVWPLLRVFTRSVEDLTSALQVTSANDGSSDYRDRNYDVMSSFVSSYSGFIACVHGGEPLRIFFTLLKKQSTPEEHVLKVGLGYCTSEGKSLGTFPEKIDALTKLQHKLALDLKVMDGGLRPETAAGVTLKLSDREKEEAEGVYEGYIDALEDTSFEEEGEEEEEEKEKEETAEEEA